MINWFRSEPMDVLAFIDKYEYQVAPRWIVTGVDTFYYEDYPVALCDTEEEVELVCLIRKEGLKPGSELNEQTWVQRPRSLERQRVL